jgi:peroxiredoxin
MIPSYPSSTCPPALTAVCSIDEQPAYVTFAEFIAAGGSATDNCGIDEGSFMLLSETSTPGNCPRIYTRTYQVADLCGNTAECTQEITVNDADPPVIFCPPALTAVCSIDEQPAYATYAEFIAAGGSATDNCGIDEGSFMLLSETSTPGNCPRIYTRTYQIADLCGNTAECTQEITVNDAELPVITCPPALTAVCSIDEQPAYATYAEFIAAGGSATDNCGIDEGSFMLLSETSTPGNCPRIYTRTYQIADLCGNTAECTQEITVNDAELPVITCPPALTAVCSIDEQPAYVTYAEFIAAGGSASDNCGIDEDSFMLLSETSTPGNCPRIYTRTYQIADLCGNTAECTQEITVNDAELPVITCPPALTAVCSIDEQPAYVTYAEFIAAGGSASDNCGIDEGSFMLLSETSTPGNCPRIYTRTYQIADLCGNTAECTQEITVNDAELPVIFCPPALTAVCSIDEQPAYATYAEFIAAGGSATDNCGIDEGSFMLLSETSTPGNCPRIYTRTYQIADLCGNTAECTQEITVNDAELPVITCPPALTAVCSIDEHPVYLTYAEFIAAGGSATDNCGIDEGSFMLLSETSTPGNCPRIYTRTYQIADLCGNTAECTQEITVNDAELPVIFCPPALTAVCSIDEQPAYATYAEFIAAGGSATDNCGIDEGSFMLLSETSTPGNCPRIYTRTYQIADLCGNTAECTQEITVNDAELPVIFCPPALTAVCSIDEQPAYATYAEFIAAGGSATDNCGIDEGSFMLLSETSTPGNCPRIYTRTYQIADLCGNTAECTQEITVNDAELPVITCPPALTAVCSIDEQPAYVTYAEFIAAGGSASDNCGIDEGSFMLLSETSTPGNCPRIYTRTYQIADLCGNTAECTQEITVNDAELPVIFCPPALTAVCSIDEQPAYATYAEFIAAGGSATDNCGIDEGSFMLLSETSTPGNCPRIYTRTYQIADLCGNTAECTQEITVNDAELPVITCPPALTAVCSIDEQPAYVTYTEFIAAGGSASDNCGIDEGSFMLLSETSTPGNCPRIYTRTYQIADLCGNTAECTQEITVNDAELPVITCPPALTAVCSIDEQPAYVTYAEFIAAGGSATDNCGIDEGSFMLLSETSTPGNCPRIYTRTYQIADLCGNTAECTQEITVNDAEPPVIFCPPALTAVCSIDEQPAYATYAEFIAAGGSATDNCGIDEGSFMLLSETSTPGNCPRIYTRTYQIADLCGNTAECTQEITVNDAELPVITCPPALTAVCSIDEQPAYVTYAEFIAAGGSASDNCGIDEGSFMLLSETSTPGNCPRIYTRTYQIADLCGNTAECTQEITVNDAELPVIFCPPALTAVCSIDEQPAYATYAEFIAAGGSATDNCGIDEGSFMLLSETSTPGNCPRIYTRTYQIADLCGNTAECTQEITVNDAELPVITCPPALTAVCSIDEQPAYVTYAEFIAAGGSATDNCGIDEGSFMLLSETSTPGNCPRIYTRTYQIADLCGNTAECTQEITVNDAEPPVIFCPPALTAVCSIDEQPAYATYAEFIAAGGSASDNCGIDEGSFMLLSETSTPGNCPRIYTRTYQIADLCGNTAECTQEITVNDAELPVITCPPALTAVCSIDEQPAYATYAEFIAAGGSATDNCGIDEGSFMLLSETSTPGNCPRIYTRTYQIADLCGNTAECTQEITVNDAELPVITCPPALTAVCSIDEQPAYVTYAEFIAAGGSASDNCGIDEGSFMLLSETSTPGNCPRIYTRTYQIADLCGNTAECTQEITVNDADPPVIFCPPALTAVCSIDEQPAYATYAEFIAAGGSASDNCGIDEGSFMLLSETSTPGNCPRIYTRTYQIADLCGNTAECTQEITVNDAELPVITCPPALTAVCSIDEQPAYVTYAEFIAAGGSASDNCGIDEGSFMLLSETSTPGNCPRIYTRTYQIADLCGNTAECTQEITVNDADPPVIFCPPALTAVCSIDEQPAYVTYAEFIAAGGSASDNCGIDEGSFMLLSETSTPGNCPRIYTRTYQIADLCGNTAECTQEITVNDAELPVITCPPALTAVCSIDEQPAYVTYAEFIAAGGSASDNCGIDEGSFMLLSETSTPGNCPRIYTRTYQIADLCGNTAECTQEITVNDAELPVIFCPPALTAVCSIDEQPAYVTYAEFIAAGGSATDNCGIDEGSFMLLSETSTPGNCPRIYTRTYQIADLCGNTAECTQEITVNDAELPVITCPPALTAVCSIDEQPAYATYAEFIAAGGSATDNCGIDEGSFMLLSETSTPGNCPRIYTRTYQIADLCGNTAECTQEITVNDAELPVITCPPALTAVCSIDEQPAYATYAEFIAAGGSATDNCGIDEGSFMLLSETSTPGNCPRIYTRTYQIADLCGNTAECTQEITVNDAELPVIFMPAGIDRRVQH